MGHSKNNTLIVDDEVNAAELLRNLLEPFSIFGTITILTNAIKAYNLIIDNQPDFLFLDIQMPELNGLELTKTIKSHSLKTKVIYVTAFDQYALEALRQNAFDYLLKPVDRAELVRVVNKLISARTTIPSHLPHKQIMVRSNEGIYQVAEEDIVYLEADCAYTTLVLNNHSNLLWSCNLGKIIPLLAHNKFIRISRKHMVNRSYIHFYHSKQKYLLLKTSAKEYKLKVMLKVHDLKELMSV